MKNILTISLCALLLAKSTGCALAQQLAMPAIPITVQAYVHDPEGRPIEGVTVNLSLPRYREGDRNQNASAVTNREGFATVSGIAQQDYMIGADKLGYYHTSGPHRGINDEKGYKKYAVDVQKIDLELRPILTPVRGITKFVDRLRIPAFGIPLGFDLELGDWVSPYGKGKVPDFIITVGGYFKNLNDYDQALMLSFSCLGDGIILTKFPSRIGPTFKFPYEAPLFGYESPRVWQSSYDGKSRKTNMDLSDETHYIFRVRTELDEKGNVRRALYGIIGNEVVLGGNNEVGRNVSFTYVLNPDWTRNIEFDREKMFEAGTGKLLVQPLPEQ